MRIRIFIVFLGLIAISAIVIGNPEFTQAFQAQSMPIVTPMPVPSNQCAQAQFITPNSYNDQENPSLDNRYIVWTEFVNPSGPEVIAGYDRGPDGIFGTADDVGNFTSVSPYSANKGGRVDNGTLVWLASDSLPYYRNILSCTMPNCLSSSPTTILTNSQPTSHFSEVAISNNRIVYIERLGIGTTTRIGIYDLSSGSDTTIFQGGYASSLDFDDNLVAWQFIPYYGYQSDIHVYDLRNNILIPVTLSPTEVDLGPKLSKHPTLNIYALRFLKGLTVANLSNVYTAIANGAFTPLVSIPGLYGWGDVEVTAGAELKVTGFAGVSSGFPNAFVFKRANPPNYAWVNFGVPLPNPPAWASSPGWGSWWGAYGESVIHGSTIVMNQILLLGNTQLSATYCP